MNAMWFQSQIFENRATLHETELSTYCGFHFKLYSDLKSRKIIHILTKYTNKTKPIPFLYSQPDVKQHYNNLRSIDLNQIFIL